MPLLAVLLSVLGLVPFIVCGLAALGPDPTTADRMLSALIGYAAVTLAFAGGIHWGFELQSRQQDRFVERARLGLGIVPPLVGWIALLLPLVAASWVSLIVLIAAYIGAVLVEQEAAKRDLLPPRYLWLRWGFTLVAVAMMITVLTLRLLGQTISFLRFVWILVPIHALLIFDTTECRPCPNRHPSPPRSFRSRRAGRRLRAMTGRSACGERSRGSTRHSPDSVRPSPPGAAHSAS